MGGAKGEDTRGKGNKNKKIRIYREKSGNVLLRGGLWIEMDRGGGGGGERREVG